MDEDGVSSKDKRVAWRIVADLDNLTTGMNAWFYIPLLLEHTPQYLVDNNPYFKSFLANVSLAFLISAITKLQERLKDSSGGSSGGGSSEASSGGGGSGSGGSGRGGSGSSGGKRK